MTIGFVQQAAAEVSSAEQSEDISVCESASIAAGKASPRAAAAATSGMASEALEVEE
jgi:hypothetical protein